MGLFDNLAEIEKLGALENSSERLKLYIIDWICSNYLKKFNSDYIYEKLRISVDMNTNPPTVDYDGDLYANINMTSLCNNGLFQWGIVKGDFKCVFCRSLKSLEGAPKEVWGVFGCIDCKSLTSLEGAPKKVKHFNCASCTSLESLKGAPKEVGGDFDCSFCDSLISLKGAPEKVGGYFYCHYCASLESLEGSPKEVGRDFGCANCKSLKTLKGSPKNVGGKFLL